MRPDRIFGVDSHGGDASSRRGVAFFWLANTTCHQNLPESPQFWHFFPIPQKPFQKFSIRHIRSFRTELQIFANLKLGMWRKLWQMGAGASWWRVWREKRALSFSVCSHISFASHFTLFPKPHIQNECRKAETTSTTGTRLSQSILFDFCPH